MSPADVEATYVTRCGDEVVTSLSDVDPAQVAEGQPVREFPVYVGRRNYSGYFWSATMRRHVVYESLLELSWLWLADFDRRVEKIAAQPMRWLGPDDDRIRTRIPDFLCLMSDGSVHVVDVKTPSAATKLEAIESLEWTRRQCHDRGWSYEVWTGADPVELRNVKLMASTRHPHVLDALDVRATRAQASEGCTVGDVEQRLRDQGRPAPRQEILGALWCGFLICDLRAPLHRDAWLEPQDE